MSVVGGNSHWANVDNSSQVVVVLQEVKEVTDKCGEVAVAAVAEGRLLTLQRIVPSFHFYFQVYK